ncbi:MAG: pantetheine-phosphate adenylyltransferase [Actinomycetaceae bacterium]|nr:pantetheine-phosphate adenylyltransferase [Actinomycetaceae bacterium]
MTLAVYPGSFDPITLGHLDVARRARALFDEVVVAVGMNSSKKYVFTADERLALAREALAGLDGVRAEPMDGLLTALCSRLGATAIVKGLRGAGDFAAEQPMALMNRHLSGIETVFVLGDPALAHIASSLVKEVARFGGDVAALVPPGVGAALAGRLSLGQRNAPRAPTTQPTRRPHDPQ